MNFVKYPPTELQNIGRLEMMAYQERFANVP